MARPVWVVIEDWCGGLAVVGSVVIARPGFLEGGGVDHEPVSDVAVDYSVIGVVDLLTAYDLDLGA
jgi:hypothetical protein